MGGGDGEGEHSLSLTGYGMTDGESVGVPLSYLWGETRQGLTVSSWGGGCNCRMSNPTLVVSLSTAKDVVTNQFILSSTHYRFPLSIGETCGKRY